MGLYIVKRLGLAAVIVVIAVSLLYGMIHAVPGDPVRIMYAKFQSTPEQIEAAMHPETAAESPVVDDNNGNRNDRQEDDPHDTKHLWLKLCDLNGLEPERVHEIRQESGGQCHEGEE